MAKPELELPPPVSAAVDLESLTRPILQLLEAVTGLESTYLTTIDEAAGVQHVLFARNTSAMQIPEGLDVPWGDTLCKRALDEGRSYTSDVAQCWGDSDAARALGIQTYMSQPVRTNDGGLYGTLCGASADKRDVPPSVIGVFTKFAAIIAQQVERERLLSSTREANAELERTALTDALTGVANRRGMEDKLGRLLARAEREGGRVAVAFVDLDGFKGINDRYGHETGDRFLVHMARKLTMAVRPGDIVSRTGGDEFVVLADGDSAPRLRERLAAATAGPFEHGPARFDYAGASVGAAESEPAEREIGPLLKRADEAMYEVKRARKAKPPA